MKNKLTYTILFIIGMVITIPCHAQLKITSIPSTSRNDTSNIQSGNDAREVACRFLVLPGKGNRTDWEDLLSKECFNNDGPKAAVNRWYQQLNSSENHYYIIREEPAPRIDQKFFYYTDDTNSGKEKRLILVKEQGKWKIFHIKL